MAAVERRPPSARPPFLEQGQCFVLRTLGPSSPAWAQEVETAPKRGKLKRPQAGPSLPVGLLTWAQLLTQGYYSERRLPLSTPWVPEAAQRFVQG